ncbi:MAG: hypothetical protein IJ421_01655 [Prevotella sp.]|nr:hypothetical protein [Prevotella sp.]MBQ8628163.1 hypothetical protein [Prevotella sp.]
MKLTKIIGLLVFSVLMLTSCDKNFDKAEEMSKQFIQAYNDNDKAAVYEMLPAVKTCENLAISGFIGQGDEINVEKDDSTGYYIATINEQKLQRLVFATDSTGIFRMIEAYGVFKIDSIAKEIALKTGVPIKKIPDLELSKLLSAQGNFIKDLELIKQITPLWANYGAYSWGRNSSGYFVSMNFTVQNSSSQPVKGEDYYLYVSPRQTSTDNTFPAKTVDGVDIAPNETREFNVIEPSLYRYASKRKLSYSVEVKYRSESILSFLLKYGTFNGEEYDDYLKHPFRYHVRTYGTSAVVNAEKEGVAYLHKGMEGGEIIDTLYHGKPIRITWQGGYAAVYNEDDERIGFIESKFVDDSFTVPVLDLYETTLDASDGSIEVYEDNDGSTTGKIIKTYPKGTKVFLESRGWGGPLVYERQPNGSMKKIGCILETEYMESAD